MLSKWHKNQPHVGSLPFAADQSRLFYNELCYLFGVLPEFSKRISSNLRPGKPKVEHGVYDGTWQGLSSGGATRTSDKPLIDRSLDPHKTPAITERIARYQDSYKLEVKSHYRYPPANLID